MGRDYSKRGENYKLLERQVREKPSFAEALPNTLIIEPGAVCSLKCHFCPQSSPSFDFSRALLSFDGFRRITDYFEEVVDTVMLFNWGEPLLNPKLTEMIRYASERQMHTVIHSNCNNLTEALAEELINSGLSKIVASIDGASQESYAAYRRGGSFASALTGLKLLCEKKRKLLKDAPDITWKFLIFRHNEHEMEEARKLAASMGVKIDFEFAVAPGEFSPSIPEYSYDNFKEKFMRYYGLPCEQLWRAVTIHADGTILPCCMVSEMKYSVGNFFRDDFRSLWNGERYRFLRQVASGRAASDESSPCYHCMFGKRQDAGSVERAR